MSAADEGARRPLRLRRHLQLLRQRLRLSGRVMGRLVDMIGQRFERLLVFDRAPNRGADVAWYCVCDCGNIVAVKGTALRQKNTRSCGCLHREIARAQLTTHGHTQRYAPSRTYRSWNNMMDRCGNPKATAY